MDDLHPVIIEDFPLEAFTEGMTDAERGAFYNGFSKCYSAWLFSIGKNERLFLSREKAEMIEHFTNLMIDHVKGGHRGMISSCPNCSTTAEKGYTFLIPDRSL